MTEKVTMLLVIKKCFWQRIWTIGTLYNRFGCHLASQLLNDRKN